jgi:hypothetical protein
MLRVTGSRAGHHATASASPVLRRTSGPESSAANLSRTS